MGTKNQRVASCGNDGRVQLHLLGKKGATHGEVGGEWVHARSIDLDVGASDENVSMFADIRCHYLAVISSLLSKLHVS